MNNKILERKHIVKELNKLGFDDIINCCVDVEDVVSWHLEEVKRIIRTAKAYRLSRIELSETWPENDAEIVIDEIVKRAGGE